MGAKWLSGANPKLIIEKLSRIVSLDDEGRLQFSYIEYYELEPLLHSAIDYGVELSFEVKKKMRDSAIKSCLSKGGVTRDRFINELSRYISLYMGEAQQQFVLVTSLSVADGLNVRKFEFGGAVLRLYKRLPKIYCSRFAYNDAWAGVSNGREPLPSGYSVVVISVSARHYHDALEIAFKNLSFLRGVLGLSINPGGQIALFGSGNKQGLNKVMLGGLHSLHYASGELVDKHNFWYESGYESVPPVTIADDKAGWVNQEVARLLRKIKRAPSSDCETLASAISRYAAAMDESDRSYIIIRLWGALEMLVLGGKQDASLMIKRCSGIFKEGEYVRETLESIRRYRNANVHQGFEEPQLDSYCYNLHRIFRHMVWFYINSIGKERSISDVNYFLDKPWGVAELQALLHAAKREITVIRKVMRFRAP